MLVQHVQVVLAAGGVLSQGCDDLSIKHESGHCMMFGQCGISSTTGQQINCFDNDPARNVSTLGQQFYELLKDTCPQYADGSLVCCDLSQLNALATQIKYPQQLFSRCPACLRNFMDHFCSTTCSPDQALFMSPIGCTAGKRSNGSANTAITNIEVFLSNEYTEEFYQSCSNVQYPQASNRVVDIMCGGTDQCNSTLWLNYLGDPNQNHNSPFMMTYIYGNSSAMPAGVVPDKYEFRPCNTSNVQYRCSCADCNTPDLCPMPPQPSPSHFHRLTVMYSILGVGLTLSFILFFAALAVAIWFAFLKSSNSYAHISPSFSNKGSSRYGALGEDSLSASVNSVKMDSVDVDKLGSDPPPSTICLPCYISGAHFENWIKIVFYHWGCFVAKFWLPVIVVGVGLFSLVVILTAVLHVTSVLPFLITTDPVKLWSAPTSRARQEKNYFDSNFNPFYRTEMVIVTPTSKKLNVLEPFGVVGVSNWTFGPALNKSVLLKVRSNLSLSCGDCHIN